MSHNVVCRSCLFYVLDSPICEVLFILLISLHKYDVTFLSIGFVVMIVQTPFDYLEVNPFVGYVDGENVPHIIVCDVVTVVDLRIGQDF